MLLGSVSFDGSLRVWNLQTNRLAKIFEDKAASANDRMINTLSWYNAAKIKENDPCRNLCVLGTVAGRIKLVDVDKNRVVWKEDFGEKHTIFDSDWS